jgi:D-alanine-D-alanine ligase
VIIPSPHPDPRHDSDWSFPDTLEQVRIAVNDHGATVLWANTTLHAQHALVILRQELADRGVKMVGQDPLDTERQEDKAWLNKWLAEHIGLENAFPRSILVRQGDISTLECLGMPAVVKPVRGRGSYGVKLVQTLQQFSSSVEGLLTESDVVLCEVSPFHKLVSWPWLMRQGISFRRGDYHHRYAPRTIHGKALRCQC